MKARILLKPQANQDLSECDRIDAAVKSDPWAFIDATLNSGERPLQNMMDWIEARHAEHLAEERASGD